MMGRMQTLNDYLSSFAQNLARMMAQWAAMQAMRGLTGLFGGGAAETAASVAGAAGGATAGIQTFQHGGIVEGGGTRHRPVLAQPGEMYLNKEQQQSLLNLLSGGVAGRGGVTINIDRLQALDTQDVLRAVTKDPRIASAMLKNASIKGTI